MKIALSAVLCACLLSMTLSACRSSTSSTQTDLRKAHFEKADGTRSEDIFLELATNNKERQVGLMYRQKMDPNQGMLFIFAAEQPL